VIALPSVSCPFFYLDKDIVRRILASHYQPGPRYIADSGDHTHALAGNRLAISQVELHTDVAYPDRRLQAICATFEEP
jgi:hypothetical protein